MPTSEVNVIHNKEENRFEIRLDSYIAELTYLLNGDTIIFTHTGVPPALEGRGLGSLLVKTGLDFARNNNLKVQSLCWFVNKYIQKHTEYRDLTK
jgi:predicted GNAT family acetyltransferase